MIKLEKALKNNLLEIAHNCDTTSTLEKKVGLLNVANGTMTSELYIFRTQLNNTIAMTISNCVTYMFDSEEEMNKWLTKKKFKEYNSDKEMYMDFTGMDEETWEEWNK